MSLLVGTDGIGNGGKVRVSSQNIWNIIMTSWPTEVGLELALHENYRYNSDKMNRILFAFTPMWGVAQI